MEKIDLKKLVDRRHSNKTTKLEKYLSIALCMLINDDDIKIAKVAKTIVEMKINGREVKFSKFIGHLIEGYEKAVDEEAKGLADNVLSDIEDKVEDMIEQFRDNINTLKEEIFLKIKDKS